MWNYCSNHSLLINDWSFFWRKYLDITRFSFARRLNTSHDPCQNVNIDSRWWHKTSKPWYMNCRLTAHTRAWKYLHMTSTCAQHPHPCAQHKYQLVPEKTGTSVSMISADFCTATWKMVWFSKFTFKHDSGYIRARFRLVIGSCTRLTIFYWQWRSMTSSF